MQDETSPGASPTVSGIKANRVAVQTEDGVAAADTGGRARADPARVDKSIDDFWFVRNLLERIRQPFGLRVRIEPQWKSTIHSNSVNSSGSSSAMETSC